MFEEIAKKGMDKIAIWFDLDDKERYSARFRKFIMWWGYKGIPAVLNIASIIILFWIAFRIYGRYGFERTAIVLMLIIIITLRGLKKE